MAKFIILPDANSDLTKELMERFNIKEVIKTIVNFPDGHSEYIDGTYDGYSYELIYEILKTKNSFSTSAPSPEHYQKYFEKYLKEGKDVLVFTLSSALSSCYSFAKQAAIEVNKKYQNKVVVIDSKRYSTSELILIMKACELANKDIDIDEAAKILNEFKYSIHQAGPMDDLKFLALHNRITSAKAFMGTLIGVNPIGEVSKDGKTSVLCKVKGGKKALRVSLEYLKRTIINPHEQIIVITHTNRLEKALLYKKMIEEEVKPKEVILTQATLTTLPNIGPGLCAAYYYGSPISDDLAKEKAIFDEITKNI